MKAWVADKIGGLFIASILLLTFAAIGVYELTRPEPLHAAAQNGCVVIGVVGNVIVARCEDEDTGFVFYANSAGMLVVEP
jgi:hypothetical protein